MISKKLFSIMFNIIKLNEKDNIGVAPMSIPKNTEINFGVFTKDKIPFGHKISLTDIKKGSYIYKYGQIIGKASSDSVTEAAARAYLQASNKAEFGLQQVDRDQGATSSHSQAG